MPSSHEPVQERITGFWSAVAPEYEAHGGNVPARGSAEYAAWVDAIRDLLPPAPAAVLDIATGTGFVALIAAGLGHRVTGIDLAGPMLGEAKAEARRRALAVAFEVGDAVQPGFPAESFDAIINRHFIWTLREPLRAFRNWLRLLRPGGRVVSIDGFWFAQASDTAATEEAPNLFDRHYTPETRAALPAMQLTTAEPIAALFREAGFASATIGNLAAVHKVAEDPPSPQPWYVVVAHR